jgi:D-serine deaminase-like pyridoxal phosphate-dependent protein
MQTPQDLSGERLSTLNEADYALSDELVSRVMTPALIIYADKVEHNIQAMLDYMGGDASRWRPHLKTTKSPYVYGMLIDAGVRNFKCATVREARCVLDVIAERGVTDADVLIAYPLQVPALTAAGDLAIEFPETRLSVLSEDPLHIPQIPQNLGIFIDINPEMNRTGIPLNDYQSISEVAKAAGERFRGLHFYDGHIHDDNAEQRRDASHALYTQICSTIDKLAEDGFACGELITSGTPTFRYALDYPEFAGGHVGDSDVIHRVSPGTVVFHDFQYDSLLEDLALQPAAMLLSRVISHPQTDIVTCDAGSKSIASEAGHPVAFVLGHPELVATPPSEEHLPLRCTSGKKPKRGDALLLIPKHVCPTVNLAEQALLVKSDGTTEVIEITARAHDLFV